MRTGSSQALRRLALVAVLTAGCATSPGGAPGPIPVTVSRTEVGIASYYGREHHGRRTASGERFDMDAMTAAHRTLPFGTRVRVTNLSNGRSVVVRINDRGPFRKRILDVSRGAAAKLGMIGAGTARVRMEILELASGE